MENSDLHLSHKFNGQPSTVKEKNQRMYVHPNVRTAYSAEIPFIKSQKILSNFYICSHNIFHFHILQVYKYVQYVHKYIITCTCTMK